MSEKLYQSLRDLAISVWIDRAEMRGGDNLDGKISEGIATADALTVLLTNNSVKSAWVKKEIDYATTLEANYSKPRVIPIVASPCRVPKPLKEKLYVGINDDDLNLNEIVKALYHDSFILRIPLTERLSFEREPFVKELADFVLRENKNMGIKVLIQNGDFNDKVRRVLKHTMGHKQVFIDNVEIIPRTYEESFVSLPAFWTSLATIIEQLINERLEGEGRDLQTVRSIADSVEAILEYSKVTLVNYLTRALYPEEALSLGFEGLAGFLTLYDNLDGRILAARRLGVIQDERLCAVDLIAKDGFVTTRVYASLNSDEHLYLQGGENIESSPVAIGWYTNYLPQVVSRELLLISLRSGHRLQTPENRLGLHLDDYLKAGLA